MTGVQGDFFGIRDVDIIWFVFLSGPLNFIGLWFGEDQRANTIKKHVEKRLDYVFKYYQLLYIQ